METRILNEQNRKNFHEYLIREEKSVATVEKYLRDTQAFLTFAEGHQVTKELVKAWKESLMAANYAPRSVNSMLASLNSLLEFQGWEDCKVKNLKIQKQT